MRQLRRLLNHFIRIIFDYHATTHPVDTDEDFLLIHPTEITPDLLTQLDTLVTQIKEKRRPLFEYLLHTITSLHQFMCQKIPIDEPQPLNPQLQRQLINFIMNVQKLLQTSQSSHVPIQYNHQDVPIAGLQRNIIEMYTLSRTGKLFKGALSLSLSLSELDSETTIAHLVTHLFHTYHCEALEKENQHLHTRIQTLTGELNTLINKLDRINEEFHVSSNSFFFSPTPSPLILNEPSADEEEVNEVHRLLWKHQCFLQKIERLEHKVNQYLSELESIPNRKKHLSTSTSVSSSSSTTPIDPIEMALPNSPPVRRNMLSHVLSYLW